MIFSRLLRKVGILHDPLSDQVYYDALTEDRMKEHDKILGRLSDISATNETSNQKLRAGIDRIKISSHNGHDVMADLVRGMKGGRHR
jgi:hypothetical protein